jgi:hypothetical protein
MRATESVQSETARNFSRLFNESGLYLVPNKRYCTNLAQLFSCVRFFDIPLMTTRLSIEWLRSMHPRPTRCFHFFVDHFQNLKIKLARNIAEASNFPQCYAIVPLWPIASCDATLRKVYALQLEAAPLQLDP